MEPLKDINLIDHKRQSVIVEKTEEYNETQFSKFSNLKPQVEENIIKPTTPQNKSISIKSSDIHTEKFEMSSINETEFNKIKEN